MRPIEWTNLCVVVCGGSITRSHRPSTGRTSRVERIIIKYAFIPTYDTRRNGKYYRYLSEIFVWHILNFRHRPTADSGTRESAEGIFLPRRSLAVFRRRRRFLFLSVHCSCTTMVFIRSPTYKFAIDYLMSFHFRNFFPLLSPCLLFWPANFGHGNGHI